MSRQEAVSLTLLRVAAEIGNDLFLHHSPIEFEARLANAFRARRQLGSRDRKILQTWLFSLWRWWGWLRTLAVNDFQEALRIAVHLDLEQMNKKEAEISKFLLDAEAPETIPQKSKWLVERFSGIFKQPPAKEALVPEWFASEGDWPLEVYEGFQTRPPVWIRIRRNAEQVWQELEVRDISAASDEMVENAVALAPGTAVHTLLCYMRGDIEIQDLNSQITGLACDPKPGERWWDACAGAGGKSILLADLANQEIEIVATEPRQDARLEMESRLTRNGITCVGVVDSTLEEYAKKGESFDGVLIDAPCTSSGTWNRFPHRRWIYSENEVDDFVKTQESMIGAVEAAGYDRVVFATCSLLPRENRTLTVN